MATQDTPQPTTQSNTAAFLAAFVANRAGAALAAWRRGAALARQQEQFYLGKADTWRSQRFECEARAARLLAEHPELDT